MAEVSVIMPVYNASDFLGIAISSVLNQTYTDIELILTDDCSNDKSWHIIQGFSQKDTRVKAFQLKSRSGAGIARNVCFSHATGRYIAFCDSDDIWSPEKISRQINFMVKNKVAISYTNYRVISNDGTYMHDINSPRSVDYHKMLKNDYIGFSTMMYDRSILGLPKMPEIVRRQDWAYKLILLKKVKRAFLLNEFHVSYRRNKNSISSKKMRLLKYNWAVYKDLEGFSLIRSSLYMARFLFYYFLKKVLPLKDR